MLRRPWMLIKSKVFGFLDDGCLTQGAAIAFYTIFSMAPVLIIVIGIAGLVFGHKATQGAVVRELSGLMGEKSASALQAMIGSVVSHGAGFVATAVGVGTLVVTATSVFTQMQTALNAIWKAKPRAGLSGLVRARLVSIGLVASLGFLLLVSLLVSTALSSLGGYLNGLFPGAGFLLRLLSVLVSIGLIAAMFAAIYKALPDTRIAWRDVVIGGVATSLLFTIGKSLIGLYIGTSTVTAGYGGAGSFILILLWVYYSAQIFLLGAEFTHAYAEREGSRGAKRNEE